MSELPSYFFIFIYLIAFLTVILVKKLITIETPKGRFENLDGLKGLLSVGVFAHHAYVWYYYIKTNTWSTPSSHLYNHLGKTSVAFFFMITSFLFATKILNHPKSQDFAWGKYFISRLFRLLPMYYVSLFVIIFIVMTMSHWQFNLSLIRYLGGIFNWLIFCIIKSPQLNGYEFSSMTNAGVVWTLAYEWLFYVSLPVLSIFILNKLPPKFYIIMFLIISVLFFYNNVLDLYNLLYFAIGMIAAFIGKKTTVPYINNAYITFFLLMLLGMVGLFHSPDNVYVVFPVALIFTLIICGNDIFGFLRNHNLMLLGDVSYSIYLLHGIFLFVALKMIYYPKHMPQITAQSFTLIISLITPLIIFISFAGYKYIESPFINLAKTYYNNGRNK